MPKKTGYAEEFAVAESPETLQDNRDRSVADQVAARERVESLCTPEAVHRRRQAVLVRQKVFRDFTPEDLSVTFADGARVAARRNIGQRPSQQDVCGAFKLDALAELADLDPTLIYRALFFTVMQLGDEIAAEFSEEMIGTTFTIAVVVNGIVYTAHIGDSNAMLLNGGSADDCVQLTWEHKPTCDIERQRIEAAGGFVSERPGDAPRLNNLLAMSRAFGNTELDKVGKTYEPSLNSYTFGREPGHRPQLLMASDGLWDVCNYLNIAQLRQDNPEPDDLAAACVREAYDRVSTDNCTVLVTYLHGKSVFYVADGHADPELGQAGDAVAIYVQEHVERVLTAQVQAILHPEQHAEASAAAAASVDDASVSSDTEATLPYLGSDTDTTDAVSDTEAGTDDDNPRPRKRARGAAAADWRSSSAPNLAASVGWGFAARQPTEVPASCPAAIDDNDGRDSPLPEMPPPSP